MHKKIPPHFWQLVGKPPLLLDADLRAYKKAILQEANNRNLDKDDSIGWIQAKDTVDDSLEICLERNINVEILQMDLQLVSASGCKDVTDEVEKRVYRSLVEGSTWGKTRAFLQRLDLHERLNSLISSTTARRNANIRESDRHAESMALRPRKASDDIIDGEFTEVAKNVGIPANDVPGKAASPASRRVAIGDIIPANGSPGKPAVAASAQETEASVIPASHDPAKPAPAASAPETKSSPAHPDPEKPTAAGSAPETKSSPAHPDPGKPVPAASGKVTKIVIPAKAASAYYSGPAKKGIVIPGNMGPKKGAV